MVDAPAWAMKRELGPETGQPGAQLTAHMTAVGVRLPSSSRGPFESDRAGWTRQPSGYGLALSLSGTHAPMARSNRARAAA